MVRPGRCLGVAGGALQCAVPPHMGDPRVERRRMGDGDGEPTDDGGGDLKYLALLCHIIIVRSLGSALAHQKLPS